jgi:transglycosylase-like protein
VAGLWGVIRMRRITLLIACACALAVAVAPASPGVATAAAQAAAPAEPAAKPAPKRYRAAYRHWRTRLRHHGLFVGRDLLAAGERARAAEDTASSTTKAELRGSIHRMQRRWGRWLRHDPRGRSVAFRLKVRSKVPAWAKSQLRSIASCESKNNPRAVGGGGAYRGMYQFSVSTWSVVGGSGDPAAASRWEQTWRAWLLLSRHGSGHWPVCG